MKLEIGAGQCPAPGYEHLDIRPLPDIEYVMDASRKLPFSDASIEGIRAKDIIEHIPRPKLCQTLQEWHRVIIPGGVLQLLAPNLDALARAYVKGQIDFALLELRIYGRQDYVENTHMCGFYPASIIKILKDVGFRSVEMTSNPDDLNLEIRAIK